VPKDTELNRAILKRIARIPHLTSVVEQMGAHTIADKLDSALTDGDVVAVRLPVQAAELRSRRVKMHRLGGRDLVAAAFADSGWTGFERPLPSMFRLAVASSTGAVFDIGANTGFYSLVAARVGGGRPIHAFEPLHSVIRLFEANLDLNHLRPRVTIVASAVGDVDGKAELFVPEPTGALIETSASLNSTFKPHHAEVLTVPVTTVDSYWRSHGSIPVSVVKVDVEGFEHAVLAGAAQMLGRARPIVFVEVLPGSKIEVIEALRDDLDYVDGRLGPRSAVFGDEIRFDPDGWNHALVPSERVDDAVRMAGRAGLAVTRI
jgi:FkbM family methyltransferase